MGIVLIAFIAVPVIEIAVFIQAGERLGLWPTLAIIVLTAMIGTALLRHQGLAILARARESMEKNMLPVAEVFDGLCLLVAGALLITPGFVTDGAGFLLFVPALRAFLRGYFLRRLEKKQEPQAGPAIDGEYRVIPPEDDPDSSDGPPTRQP